MTLDEMFVVGLLLFCVALIAGSAIYSRRAHRPAAVAPEVAAQPTDPPARNARRPTRRAAR